MAPQDDVRGRQFDYQTALNINYIPRATEAVSFQLLKYLSQNWPLLRLVIETRKDQVEAQNWTILPREAGKGKRPASSPRTGKIKEITAFFASPDKRLDWSQWLRAVLDQHFVYDGVALYKQRNRGGALYALQQVDAATIKPLIDSKGRLPLPPSPAYQQVLKGVPASDYTTFAAGELIYAVKNTRADHIYGYGPVEQIITWAEIGIQRMRSQQGYFVDGNIPDGFLTAGANSTPEQIMAVQNAWDAIFAGNVQQRRKAWWVPHDSKWQPMKQPPLKDDFDEWLARVVCFAFSISPQWAVKQMNRASAGTAQEVAAEEGLQPTLMWTKRLMDKIIREDFDAPDLEFSWESDAEFDPAKAVVINTGYAKIGAMTIDEVRDNLGLDKLGGAASKPMVLTPAGFVPLEPQIIAPGAVPGGKNDGANPAAIDNKPTAPPLEPTLTAAEKLAKSAPIPLYISRPVINAHELVAWAEAQGFGNVVPWDEMHVTIAHSRAPVDWDTISDDATPLVLADGGYRMVSPLGPKGAIVLMFENAELSARWVDLCAQGCSWDFVSYMPHVTIAYGMMPDPPIDSDPETWEPQPFDGVLVFGAEERQTINDMGKVVPVEVDKSVDTPFRRRDIHERLRQRRDPEGRSGTDAGQQQGTGSRTALGIRDRYVV
jgi:hypothetical protein